MAEQKKSQSELDSEFSAIRDRYIHPDTNDQDKNYISALNEASQVYQNNYTFDQLKQLLKETKNEIWNKSITYDSVYSPIKRIALAIAVTKKYQEQLESTLLGYFDAGTREFYRHQIKIGGIDNNPLYTTNKDFRTIYNKYKELDSLLKVFDSSSNATVAYREDEFKRLLRESKALGEQRDPILNFLRTVWNFITASGWSAPLTKSAELSEEIKLSLSNRSQ